VPPVGELISRLRDCFRALKKQLEANAAAKPQYGNLTIEEITEQPSGPDSPSVRVTLRRTQFLEIESNDRELMHDFLDKNWNETEIAPEKQARLENQRAETAQNRNGAFNK
jgi:hypothetical protein